jgi:hypothetical protein
LKPQVVEVNVRGRIDAPYKGKTTWDDTTRSITPRVVDVSIIHVKDQNHVDMANLHQQMDEWFEYLNNPLSIKGLEDSVCRFFKVEQSWLKHLYMKKGQRTCPMGMELDQW